MRSLKQYITESLKSYNYTIKIAGDVDKNFIDMFKYNLNKFDPIRIFERLKESAQKLNFEADKVSYSEVCLQYFKVNRNLMILPLIVVENCTALDVNDCYFRSIKREIPRNKF